jgi:hypothetical protein
VAVNPATLKAAAKAAVSVLTDEDARRKVMIVAAAPLAVFILIVSLFFYVLTMPLQILGDFFAGSDYDAVRELRTEHGYDQSIDISEWDYIDGSGIDYGDIVFTDGATPVVYFNQLDSNYAGKPYGTDKIGTHGCGPTSLAMAVSSLTDLTVDPIQTAEWSVANGGWCKGNGSYHSLIPDGAAHFGLTADFAGKSDILKIADALASGKLVIAIMSAGHFTKGGHFIVLRGITGDGKILVADPASRSRSEQEWDFSVILNEARKDAGAGGPFWILGKSP